MTQNLFKAMVLAMAGMILVYFAVGSLLADRWWVDTERTLPAAPAEVEALVHDFGTWAKWSSMDAQLGPQTTRTVQGAPGTVGHQVAWSGSEGRATLTMTAVAPGEVAYEFHGQRPGDPAPVLRGRGRVQWAAQGQETVVRWHDEGAWDNLAGRWVGWFGALQERVKQIQGTSLEGLGQAVEGQRAAAKAPAEAK